MKKLLLPFLFGLFLCRLAEASPIVNNNGTDGTDTLLFPFTVADSAGNPNVVLASGDSVFLHIWGPNATIAYRDSSVWNGAKIIKQGFRGSASRERYVWKQPLQTAFGSSPDGIYTWMITACKTVGGSPAQGLETVTTGFFQLVGGSGGDLQTRLANLNAAVGTRSTYAPGTDSVIVDGTSLAATAGAISKTTFAVGAIDSMAIAQAALNAYRFRDTTFTARLFAGNCIGPGNLAANTIGDDEWGLSTDVPAVNVIQISADAGAADNLETMLDGTGGQTLSLGRLAIASGAGITAVSITGNTTGLGLDIQGGASAQGVRITGGGGTPVSGTEGLAIAGGTNKPGIYSIGNGTNAGVYWKGGASAGGVGLLVEGGANGGDAVQFTAISNGDGLQLTGVTQKDFNATIDLDDVIGSLDSAQFSDNSISGNALSLFGVRSKIGRVVNDSVWRATLTQGQGGGAGTMGDDSKNWDATGSSFNPASDVVIVGSMRANVIADTNIQTGAIGSTEFVAEKDIWNVKYDTAYTVGSIGDTINNATAWTGRLVAQTGDFDRIVVAKGKVAASPVPTSTSFSSTALGGANDYWNSNMVLFTTGTLAGQVADIQDFTSATKLITMDARTAAPAADDSFMVLGIYFAPATGGTGSGADSGAVNRILSRTVLGDYTVNSGDYLKAVRDSVEAWDATNTGLTWRAKSILDSIQAWDATTTGLSWQAKAILDSIQGWDAATTGLTWQAKAILDSLRSQDDWEAANGAAAAATAVWGTSFLTAFGAGTMGDSLNNATYVQGTASGLTPAQVWNYAFTGPFTNGSMGDSLNNASYVQGAAAGLDSGTVNRLLSRTLLGDYTVNSGSKVKDILDSIQAWDEIGGATARIKNILDSVQAWDNATTGMGWQAKAILDSIQAWDAANTGTNWQTKAILDSIQAWDAATTGMGWQAKAILDSIQAWDEIGGATYRIKGILDSVQAWDASNTGLTWQAKAILDSIQAWDAVTTGPNWQVKAILDSIQGWDAVGGLTWRAKATADSLASVATAARYAALRWGSVPPGYDSTITIYSPANGSVNKDSVWVIAYRLNGTVADTIVGADFINSNVPSVADYVKTKRRP